ncbi:MAG TPA: hypothetical protein VGO21_03625 [Candidatus Paceibacterota bacterium]|jgi:adenylate cyclase class 2|nr:hypothetical protein [Candidatus Paceibacterota bacterium]
MGYLEKEVKILDVVIEDLLSKFKELGAKEVFNDNRIITHFDYHDGRLFKQKKVIKLTEEGKLKLSYSINTEHGKETIKLFVSRKKEVLDFLNKLDLFPISESTSHRISFEWEGVDFDIDEFPQIPPFLEIDLGESKYEIKDVLTKLGLGKNENGEMGTPDIYKRYNLDYFKIFKIKKI